MPAQDRHNLAVRAGICGIAVLVFGLAADGRQEKVNWNQFRGPDGQGAAPDARIPVHFGPDTNVLWRTDVPPGHSSPILWNDRLHDSQIQRDEMAKGFAFIQRPELPQDNPGYGLPVRDMDTLLRIFDHDKDGVIREDEWMETMAGFAARSHPTLMALRPGATKDARRSHLAWEIQRGIPETPSPLRTAIRLRPGTTRTV